MGEPKFVTEAELCASFLAAVAKQQPDLRCYPESGGFDILIVFPNGWQLGIEAKLKLNAKVIEQASPADWWGMDSGPDFRAVLVPDASGLADLAKYLGLAVIFPLHSYKGVEWGRLDPTRWIDWNPAKQCRVPDTATDSIAGSPSPVTLTQWKVSAIRVIAHLEVAGTITPTMMRGIGCDPRRWCTAGWLVPAGERGVWKRGDNCPPFNEQHPTAYAVALENELAAAAPAPPQRET